MSDDARPAYLAGVTAEQAQQLAEVNAAGLAALRRYLDAGEAVAFLGAGVSVPLYPLWTAVIGELVDAAAARGLPAETAATIRAVSGDQPDAAVELVRRHLGAGQYREALREAFRVRRDPVSGRTWTPVQELVCRCAFRAVVTTNYDPGIVDARMRVRPAASGTGFTSWTDELGLDRWRTGEVFGEAELPVLFAHGHHNQPDAIVLATTEYRRAYAGKLSRVLAGMVDAGHLVWIGFSFADQRIGAILREVAEQAGTRIDPAGAARHVAIMGWNPERGQDPQTLRSLAEISYQADLILYPTPGGDHSALQALLAEFTVPEYPPVVTAPAPRPAAASTKELPVRWMPPAEPVPHFTGRTEELARLSRWAADPAVRLVGVTAWGGAGKTAVVTEWLNRRDGMRARPGVRGLFGWSFYADPSAEHWVEAMLDWAAAALGVGLVGQGRPSGAVLTLLHSVRLVLVLDGLEVVQEGPEGGQFGRLLDGTLREVLTGACQLPHAGLVVLTSRFPFADLEGFDGDAARMLDVPPFTLAEGATLLAAAGGSWLPEADRRTLVADVDGHALAVAALGGVLADRPPTGDLTALRAELATAAGTSARVARVLDFYANRLTEADRYLVAGVALFTRPVTPAAVLAVAAHSTFEGRLDGWTPARMETAARGRLAGLLSWHPDGTLSAHPLVRDAFRPLALGAAEVAADTSLRDVPAGKIANRDDGLRVVEAIELLLAADQWQAANDLYRDRSQRGAAWKHLPAARLGQRAAFAFVATPARRRACADRLTPRRLRYYLNDVGLWALFGGDLVTARQYLEAAARQNRDAGDLKNASIDLQNLTECLGYLGQTEDALRAGEEAAETAARAGDRDEIRDAAAYRGYVLMLAGASHAAEEQFLAADRIRHADEGCHLYSLTGSWCAEFLTRTGRPRPARELTEHSHSIAIRNGWNEDIARCDRMLARLDLHAGDLARARDRLVAAEATFRAGDFLVELARTLPLLAECLRRTGSLADADRYASEALTLAGPRRLVPAQVAALAARGRIFADRAAAGDLTYLERGRDAADTAHRLATRHRLPWHDLDAIEAHGHLDAVEGVDRGWAGQAARLRASLIPADLDPDPLGTVERQVAAEKAGADDKP